MARERERERGEFKGGYVMYDGRIVTKQVNNAPSALDASNEF